MQPLNSDNRYRVYDRSQIRAAATAQVMGQRPGLRRDPAPSRWAYRMQRLWLTPLFRVTFRIGLPIFLIALIAGLYLRDDARRAQVTGVFTGMVDKFQARPEFRVSLISVEGAAPELADAIRARLQLNLPQSSFDLDLDAARQHEVGFSRTDGVRGVHRPHGHDHWTVEDARCLGRDIGSVHWHVATLIDMTHRYTRLDQCLLKRK